MEKEPFTPEGLTALQSWLNGLASAQFDAEIAAMQQDFERWASRHLELSAEQSQFYEAMSATAKQNLAYLVTLAAAYKRNVSLVQEGPGEPSEDKLFRPKSSLSVTTHQGGGYDVDGELVIEVRYIA